MLVEKLEKLQAVFAQMERALIAYSGGIDSTLVAKIAGDILADRALAVTAVSPSLLPEDLEDRQRQINLENQQLQIQQQQLQLETQNQGQQ